MHIIETRDLCHTYKNNIDALKNISFIAPRNTRIAIIGPNGAGKSTLFKHFNGVLKPTSGKVLIRGEPITKENIREVRRTIGLVFQNPDDQIFSPTVEQDVAFGPANMGLDDETVKHRVSEALRTFGLSEYRTRVPHHLSGGEKKRVAIAGIIAMEPQVLVLDEPTAGLDSSGSNHIMQAIQEMQRNYHTTVVMISHYVSQLMLLADKLVFLKQGRLLACGNQEEVFQYITSHNLGGLILPDYLRLMHHLADYGYQVNTGVSSLEEAAREIGRILQESFLCKV